MKTHYSISEAKNRLPHIVHDVEAGTPVTFTRHGKPVAVILSVREYERLNQKKDDFWDALTSFRKMMAENNIEFTDRDFDQLRDASVGREVGFAE